MVVPTVVVATITVQYKKRWNDFALICAVTATIKNTMKIKVLTAYPSFIVMESASPPVSPSVVAAILMIQNAIAICGTLLATAKLRLSLARSRSCGTLESLEAYARG